MLQTTLRVSNASNVGTTGLTDANIKFRRSPFGTGDVIASVEVSGSTNGIYLCDFIGIPYQAAQLWIDGVYQSTWGTKYVGDIIADLNGQIIKNAGAGTANGHLVRFEQTFKTSGNHTISGGNTFTGTNIFQVLPLLQDGDGNPLVATTNPQAINKKQLDDAISSLVLSSYQESIRRVRIIPSGTQEANKVYTSILAGVTSFATPGASNLCLVDIIDNGGASFITAASGSLINYVALRGAGHHIAVHFNFTTATAITKVENMVVILGVGSGGTLGARTFASLEFHNCIIYHYAGLTFNGCPLLKDCLVLGSSTNAVTISGLTNIVNCCFNNEITLGASTGVRLYSDNFSLQPPADPTGPP